LCVLPDLKFTGVSWAFSSEATATPAKCRLENGNMLDLLKGMLTGQNAFASGGLLLMVIGGLSVYLRAVREKRWYWIVGQTTMIITVKDDDRNGVTLSGLLNVLDGFYAPTNVLFMMTTNRIESLDEALLRPGRIDYKLYLGKASARQKIEL
jgi:hypothetical protein